MAVRRSLENVVEVVLFASEDALSVERIAAALERQDATPAAIREAIGRLNESYRQGDRTFEIVEVAGGYKMMTLPEYNNYVRRVLRSRSRDRLSQAAMETLAIVAYRQPVTRAEIENIRGVEAGPMLRMLVDRGLVRIVGRAEALGHPLLYGTTKTFLEHFGLKDLDSLPRADELMRQEAERDAGAEDEFEEADEATSGGEAVAGAMAALAGEDGGDEETPAAEPAEGAAAGDDDAVIRMANHLPAEDAAESESPADEETPSEPEAEAEADENAPLKDPQNPQD